MLIYVCVYVTTLTPFIYGLVRMAALHGRRKKLFSMQTYCDHANLCLLLQLYLPETRRKCVRHF